MRIAFYEVGKRRVPVSMLPGLAKLLDVSIEMLIADDDAAPGAGQHPASNSNSMPSAACPRSSGGSSSR